MLIDGKGDRDLLERLKRGLAAAGEAEAEVASLDIGRIEESFVTNPLLYGSAQQIVDRVFSSFTFESEYFKNISQAAALLVARVLKAAGEAVTFQQLFSLLQDDGKLAQLIKGVKDTALLEVSSRLLSTARRERLESYSGLLAQLAPFAEGELAPLVNANGTEANFFSLAELLAPGLALMPRTTRVAVVLIPELLYQETARRLGKVLLQEVAWAVGYRESAGYREFTPVYLDEFGSFVYGGFLGLLNKARSTGVALHLSHQSLGDIRSVSPEFAMALHTNCNVKCVLGVNDPETADFFAKHFGTRKSEKATERAQKKSIWADAERTGEMSIRDVKEYRIDPDNLRHYSMGRGVLSLILDGHVITEEMQFAKAPY